MEEPDFFSSLAGTAEKAPAKQKGFNLNLNSILTRANYILGRDFCLEEPDFFSSLAGTAEKAPAKQKGFNLNLNSILI